MEQSSARLSSLQINILKYDLCKANREEKSHWSQKCRQKGLKEGDDNTKFFHASVKAERSRNALETLIDENGVVQRSEASKGVVASDYFSKLFTSTNPDDFEQIFVGFRPTVTREMNEALIGRVSKDEIRYAIFSIKTTKALGPDGMTRVFFQEY